MKLKTFTSSVAILLAFTFLIDLRGLRADDDDKAAGEEAKADKDDGIDEDGTIQVDRVDVIEKHIKKAVIVQGTIKNVKVFDSGHTLMKFEEADVGVFIRKADREKHKDWDLEALEGLTVYVAGQVKIYRDQLELVIVGPDQIAATPEKFDIEKIPLPETQKKTGGSNGLKLICGGPESTGKTVWS